MGQLGFAGNESPLGKTSSVDLRRILRAMYVNADSNPIMSGGDIIGRSDRAYGFGEGVGVLGVGNGAVMMTWPAGQTALVSQPSVPRTDVIYCDASGAVRVGTEGSVPENQVIVIRKMIAPAGMTATTQAVPLWDRNWAMPYGAQIGWFNAHREFHEHGTPVPKTMHTIAELPFYCPTDRDIQFSIHQAIFGQHDPQGTGLADFGAGWMLYHLYVDNVLIESWEMGYDRGHEVRSHTVWDMDRHQGEHRARLERRHTYGANPLHIGGTVEKFARGFFGVIDRGVAREHAN